MVPVSSSLALETSREPADEVVCKKSPDDFLAVYDYYENFEQVSDDRAIEYLS